jgi:1,4-dihydroxy-2-naphthoyl-CoA hydrolase
VLGADTEAEAICEDRSPPGTAEESVMDEQRPAAGVVGQAVEALAGIPAPPIHERLGITIVHAEVSRVVATMAVEGNTQPFGLLHGGASVVLAESLGSIGATLHGMPERVAVGTDVNATHHRAVSSGIVTGTATPLHLGRTIACYEVVVTDDHDRRVCTARITCQLVPARR